MADLQAAVDEYQRRRDRQSHPSGKFDSGGRWYPSNEERRGCCSNIRSPSRAYPYSLMLHCRTIEHVAALYGIGARELRAAVRKAARPGPSCG